MDPQKRTFLLNTTIFRGYVSSRECNTMKRHKPFLKEILPVQSTRNSKTKNMERFCQTPICPDQSVRNPWPDFLWVDLSGSILKRSSTTNSIRDPIMRPLGGPLEPTAGRSGKVSKGFLKGMQLSFLQGNMWGYQVGNSTLMESCLIYSIYLYSESWITVSNQ